MEPWDALFAYIDDVERIRQAAGVLSWDQQTHMPPGGAVSRGKQLAALSAVVHQRMTAPELQDMLSELEADTSDLNAAQRAGLHNLRRGVDKATCTPAHLVKSMAEARATSIGAWNRAKAEADFSIFQPALEQVVALRKEALTHRGDAEHVYDHLLDDYDPGTTTAFLKPMFQRLGDALQPLVDQATAQSKTPFQHAPLPLAGLKNLNQRIVTALGFRENDGRLDESAHPFTLGVMPNDVRLTTHYHTDNLLGTLFGTIHETGHGLYEQGLPTGTNTLTHHAAGTGMHESQSRFWENVIGRSHPFAEWLSERIAEEIPALDLNPDQLFVAFNQSKRSLIRIYSDELTYNLHIIVRFQLECALFGGALTVADLPDAWNDAYANIVGVRPDSAASGVLQDVHWAMGLFGYFPSYTIGNLYAASQRFAMEAALPSMWSDVRRGDFTAVLGWLRQNIHDAGNQFTGPQLQQNAVGERDAVTDLINHLRQRQAQVTELQSSSH